MPLERATPAEYEHSWTLWTSLLRGDGRLALSASHLGRAFRLAFSPLSHAYTDAELAEEQLSDEPEIYCEDVLINFSDFAGDSEMYSCVVSVRVFPCFA